MLRCARGQTTSSFAPGAFGALPPVAPSANLATMRAAPAVSVLAAALLLVACEPPSQRSPAGDGAAPPRIELVQASGPVELTPKEASALVARVEKAIAVCNFSSKDRPGIFGDKKLEELWSERASGPHLLLRYSEPKTIDAIAGRLEFREVMLSVGQPYGPEPALVKSDAVLGLKKCGYDDRMLGCDPELRAHFPAPPACPPGF